MNDKDVETIHKVNKELERLYKKYNNDKATRKDIKKIDELEDYKRELNSL